MASFDLSRFNSQTIGKLSNEQLKSMTSQLLTLLESDTKENQILFYEPASERAEAVHHSTAKWVGISGGNGCLPLDAPVLMANGKWKELQEIKIGDRVMGADPVTRKTTPVRVLNTFRSGINPVYKVEFSDGGWFEATANHKVPLMLGAGRKTTKGHPKLPIKRLLGDYIEPIMRRGKTNPSKRISCVSPIDIRCEGAPLPIDPYLLGILLGDGSLQKSIKLHSRDEEIVDRVREIVPQYRVYVNTREYSGGRVEHLLSTLDRGINQLTNIFRELGLFGCNSYSKFIPEPVFSASRKDRMNVLAGLIDSDGSADSYVSVSEALATGFVRLVRSLGGKATLKSRIYKSQHGTEVEGFYIYHRLNERIPLSLPRKQKENQKGRPIDYTRRVCRAASLSRVTQTGDIEVDHPAHCYITKDYTIVSNSSKTETALVHMIALASGVFPIRLFDVFNEQFRGPINCRVVVESFTTTLYPIILPKLKYFAWTGVDSPGGEKGHWGWVPRNCLIDGSWERSWSEKTKMLTINCKKPGTDNIVGQSQIQFMSKDQDPTDFASGDFHFVLHDEPPLYAQWRENQARTMRVGGRIFLSFTWPDDPVIPVDWIFDELYDKKDENHDWHELWTTENKTLNQDAIAAQAAEWSEETKRVRLFGGSLRFSNRVHPTFTDLKQTWCFTCRQSAYIEGNLCLTCKGADLEEYCHVQTFEYMQWPVVFLLDPHPRKPHMFLWAEITPSDDIRIILEGKLDDTPDEVAGLVYDMEEQMGLNVALRLIDPNMGRSPAGVNREITWQDEFDKSGLMCELSDDSSVGRQTVNKYLNCDDHTRCPRLIVHERCSETVHQIKRYVWDDYKSSLEKDIKQTPRPKYDDYPTLIKYLVNHNPQFNWLHDGPPVIRGGRGRRGAY